MAELIIKNNYVGIIKAIIFDKDGTLSNSEQYLLDIEREAFLSLCSERKTLERIQHMLKTGKPLRN